MEQCGITQRENSNSLRGFCALMIVLTHLIFFVEDSSPYTAFSNIGYLCVGVFFFYTGYNQFYGWMHNPDGWTNQFWRKKLVRLWLPYALSNIYYMLVLVVLNDSSLTPLQWTFGTIGVQQISSYSWYITAVFVYYAIAYVVLRLLAPLHRHVSVTAFGVFAACVMFIGQSIVYDMVAKWQNITVGLGYRIPLCLPAGMLWCVFEPQLKKLLQNKWVRGTAQVMLFFAAYLVHNSITHAATRPYMQIPYISDAFNIVSPLLTVLFAAAMLESIQLNNSILAFFGRISLEMYLYHIPVFWMLRNAHIYVQSTTLFVLLGVGLIVLISAASHYGTEVLAKHTLKRKSA